MIACGKSIDHDPLVGKPRLQFIKPQRFAMVYKPHPFQLYLWGLQPGPDQYFMLVVKVNGIERGMSVGQLYGRLIPGNNKAIIIVFTVEDYYEAQGQLQGDGFRTHLIPSHEVERYRDPMEDDGKVPVEFILYLAEPDANETNKSCKSHNM
jgi:hypothetical protein